MGKQQTQAIKDEAAFDMALDAVSDQSCPPSDHVISHPGQHNVHKNHSQPQEEASARSQKLVAGDISKLLNISTAQVPTNLGPRKSITPIKIYLRKDGFYSPGVEFVCGYKLLKLEDVELSTDQDYVKRQVLARFRRIQALVKGMRAKGPKGDKFLFDYFIKVLQRLRGDGQLPKNWVMGLDVTNQTPSGVFYVNTVTEEASWSFPIPLQSVDIGRRDTMP